MHIVVELEELLKERGVSLYEFCRVSDISYQQGLEITKQRTKGISFEVIEKVCTFFNCRIGDLFKMESDIDGFIAYLIDDFPDTDNVRRVPKTKITDGPKPVLQWVGGKREMIKQYNSLFPKKFKVYWEPFFGGGAVYFYLCPDKAIVNDNNPELIETYKAVRDKPEYVIDLLKQLRRKHSKELYMALRSIDRKLDITTELKGYEIAARMIYLNQTCFNGIYRVNKRGEFNVPIGSSLNRVICDPEAIRKASRVLKTADISNEDFEDHIAKAKKGDFVYLDPPYMPVSEYSDFTRYTKEKFYKHDQLRLRDVVKKLSDRGCFVMLSNSDSDFIKEIYSDLNIHTVSSSRNLNSRSDRRGKVAELVITNY